MLRLLRTPETPGERKVKWSVNYERMLKKHGFEQFGSLSAFLKQNQLVLEAPLEVRAASRRPSLSLM